MHATMLDISKDFNVFLGQVQAQTAGNLKQLTVRYSKPTFALVNCQGANDFTPPRSWVRGSMSWLDSMLTCAAISNGSELLGELPNSERRHWRAS